MIEVGVKRENVEQPLGSLLDDRDGKGGVENMGGVEDPLGGT